MDRKNLVPLLVIILAASVFTYLMLIWSDNKPKETQASLQPIFKDELFILVAAENLTLGQKLQKHNLIWQQWPKEKINENHFIQGTRNIEYFVNMIVSVPINQGDPILPTNIIQPAQRNVISAILKPGKRAFAIEVNEITGVGGFIFPGDYVDIISTVVESNTESQTTTSKIIAKDILVVAIDQITSRDASDIAKIVKTVTVEVTPSQSEIIATAQKNGTVSLSLQGLLR